MTGEYFRPVPGWEGYYDVSNLGRVRSVDRTLVRRNGARYRVKGRILKPQPVNGRSQHRAVTLARDGCSHTRLVSVLVREAWGNWPTPLASSEDAA